MSSTSQHQQHLSSANMAMIERVLGRTCTQNAIAKGSVDAERTAALLIREFQYGVNTEAELMNAFMGDGVFKLSVPTSRLSQFIGNALNRWEAEAHAPASR